MKKKSKSGKSDYFKNKKSTSIERTAKKQAWSKWFPLVIFGFAFLLYANTLTHDYTQDDAIVITENMFTQQGLEGIPGILQNDTFFGFFKVEGKDKLVAGGRYRPFTLIMFALENELFGNNPLVGHLFNIIFYGLLGVVLYWVLRQLFHLKSPSLPPVVALLAVLLFIAHPVHTEVVANIKGRDEIMALLGSLLALYFVIKSWRTQQLVWQIPACICFFAALLSKENASTFLAVIPLALWTFSNARGLTIIKQTFPLVAVFGLFLWIRGTVLGGNFGGSLSMELMNNPFLKIVDNRWVPLGFAEQMATIFYTLGKYLQLLVFPHPLTHDYYPRHIGVMQWTNPGVIVSLLAYLSLAGTALWGIFTKKIWAFSIAWYLLTLSIVSNLLFPIGTNMSERFLFMPSAGFCLLLAWGVFKLSNFAKVPPKTGGAIFIIILAAYSIKTVTRNFAWKDNFTLFTTDIQVSKNSAKLRNAVGGELSAVAVKEKNTSKREKLLREAIGHLKEAIRIHPTYKNAYLLLGNAYNYLQEYDEAIRYYDQALGIAPNYQDAINNRAITYRDAGLYFGKEQGNLSKAIQYLSVAYQEQPEDYETVFGLGVAYGMSGNLSEAIKLFEKTVQLEPGKAAAWRNLGNAYMNAGNVERGQQALQKANALEQ